MPRIAILPSAVADQIAAGEVVERPASVVKELIENAVDAGATCVELTVTDGGRTFIRVSDDGCGMERNDALLSLARHGTSKISSAHDLASVSSFGFRGEALPAICSVSRLEIETAAEDGTGTHLRAAGGTAPELLETSRRRGTTVTVAQLFYNVPARLKFLRSARSEWRAISDTLTSFALARRDIRLAATHDGRLALSLPPAPALRSRLAGLWGGRYAESLLDVDSVAGPIRVAGLAERPSSVGTATRRVHVCVNGRAIRDNGLVRAAESGYRSTIAPGLRPSVFLDITVPHESVDVNVHPAKAEVRFRDRWPIERAVEGAIRTALGNVGGAASVGSSFGQQLRQFLPDRSAAAAGLTLLAPAAYPADALFGAGADDAGREHGEHSFESHYGGDALAAEPAGDSDSARCADQIPPLTQLRRTYIMFEHEGGVVLIDQHSAHERVLYERFMHTLETGDTPSQRLLLPITLHLGPAEGDAFDANRSYLERLGFEIEGFGGHTLIVSAVPVPHARFDAERCLRETLDTLTGDRVAGTAARHERLAATFACKAAVRAGDVLSQGEMRALFAALRDTALPAHDVHGRSAIVQLPWDELERRFGRQ